MNSPPLQAGLVYQRAGLSVIPIRGTAYANGETDTDRYSNAKMPLLSTWKEYQQRMATEEEIRAWFFKWPKAGLAIVTGEVSSMTSVDLDSQEAIDFFLANFKGITPTVSTPRGLHAHFLFEPGMRNTVAVSGMKLDIRGTGGYVIVPPTIMPSGKKYEWITSITNTPLAPLPSFLKDRISSNTYLKESSFSIKEYEDADAVSYDKLRKATVSYGDFFKEGSRDSTLFHVSTCLKRGGMEEPLARKVLVMLASQCDPPFSLDDAEKKILSAWDRSERREKTLAEEIRTWVLTTVGYFLTMETHAELRITTAEEKKACYSALLRMSKGPHRIIEPHGGRRGCFRVIDNQCEEIDFVTATGDALGIKWPFEIERLVKILPKNVIVIAGEPNAGKSAFLLNLAEMNMNKFDVHYFSSEMGALELRDRISNFKTPAAQWKVKFKERASNFADVIVPDAINIIDFLEIHDEFYKVGGFIKEIFDKLTTGIAVIALQKNRGNDFGLGGQRGMEKARLYLAMQEHELRIVKGKNWATQQNPSGLSINFDTIAGAKLLPRGTWE